VSLASHRREAELFDRALDLDPGEQRAFVERACEGDAELARRLLALLARDRETGTSLDRSAVERLAPPAHAARIPEEIGPYRILGLLGAGGMGIVYRAEQRSPRREVALKVIRGGLASVELVRRFEKEAHVLGRLDHQGIARVYDAGVFDGPAGPEPFVAMELVEGEPLLEHVKLRQLSRTARIELLARICDAVAHAHDHGVVHRDLKPSNVIVKPDGEPKVLDFGVALIVGADAEAITRQTSIGELVGTLPYMSPEQLEGDPASVDGRSDVYALGVMAYEVLTGKLPHELAGVSVPAAARIVIESAPPKLSDHDRALRGDLEKIVGKALAKDRAQRYASVRELGLDLRRHLRHEPVLAVPPSSLYYLRRFARRNPALTASLVLAAVLLVAGTVVSTWQARRAEDARLRAEESARRAALHAARVASEHQDFATSRRLLDSIAPADRGWVWKWLNAGLDGRIAAFASTVPMRAAAFLPDSEEIVSADASGTVARWIPGDTEARARLDLGDPLTGPAAFDPEGAFVAGVHGGEKETVTLWEARTGKCIGDVDCSGTGISVLAVAPGGRYVAIGGRSAYLWEPSSSTRTPIHPPAPTGFAFTTDGTRLACAYTHPRDGPGWFTMLYLASARPTQGAFRVVSNDTRGIALGSDGVAAVGARDKRVYLLDTSARKVAAAFTADTGPVQAVAFDRAGERLATGSSYGTVRLFDAREQKELAVLGGSRAGVLQVAFSGDGSRVLAVAGNEIGVWDVASEAGILRGHASYVYDVAFVRRGSRLVSLSYDGELCVRDAAMLELLRDLGGKGSTPTSYAMDAARDVDRIAIGRMGCVTILDGDSFETIRTLPFHSGDAVREVSFSPDGARLAVLFDTRVDLMDVANGEQLGRWSCTASTPYGALAFSPDGRSFVHSSGDEAVVRNASTGAVIAHLAEHHACVEALAFSPDGSLLASGALDTQVRLWDTRTWSPVAVLSGHEDRVYCLAFSPDGRMLASGSNDTTIRLWSVPAGEELAVLTGHEDYVFNVAFDPDGSRLASASGDRTVRIWDTLTRSERWSRRPR
jgi:WD40 repeat protein/serine/threonine protein kinase